MALSKHQRQERRKKYPRAVAELTVDEHARWVKRCLDLGQSSAERLRRLILVDLAHRSTDPLMRVI